MRQKLEMAIFNTYNTIIKINLSMAAYQSLIIHRGIFCSWDPKNHRLYGIPYEICPGQDYDFEIITTDMSSVIKDQNPVHRGAKYYTSNVVKAEETTEFLLLESKMSFNSVRELEQFAVSNNLVNYTVVVQ